MRILQIFSNQVEIQVFLENMNHSFGSNKINWLVLNKQL